VGAKWEGGDAAPLAADTELLEAVCERSTYTCEIDSSNFVLGCEPQSTKEPL